jgi:SAM-dependent methyltransferase
MTPSALDRPTDIHLDSAPQQLEYDLIAERVAADGVRRVLDWGAGLGQMSSRLRERGLEVVAFDYEPGREQPAVQPLPRFPELEVHLSGDPVRLPFDDDAFDAVLSCGVLEHVARPDDSLEEIKRVLRPGGALYVYKLPNRYSYLEWIAKQAGLYYHGAYPYDAVYTRREARELVSRHGYSVSELRLENMLPLTLRGGLATRGAGTIFRLGRLFSRVPGLNLLATNVELVARAPD